MATTLADEFILRLGQDPLNRPRRVVTRSGWRVRGITPSLRFQSALTWESDIERRLIYLLRASWRVADACSQAVRLAIPVMTGDRPFIDYTPDALVKDQHGNLTCVECKPAAQLEDPELQVRHRDIKLFLSAHGIRFVEVTDIDLASLVPLENAKLLFRGFRSLGRYTSTDELRRTAEGLLPCTYSKLVAELGSSKARAALFLGFAYFDMHSRLNGQTVLSPQFEEKFDAAHFLFA